MLVLAGLAAVAHSLGDIGPRPAAAGITFEAMQGREEFRDLGRPHPMSALQARHQGVDFDWPRRCLTAKLPPRAHRPCPPCRLSPPLTSKWGASRRARSELLTRGWLMARG